MTTMDREVKKCAVCGSKHEYTVIASTNSFGAPDLDLRPPEMERSTMSLWVQECPDCGYVASNITNKPGKVTKEWLALQAYVTCDGIRFRSGLASRFYKLSELHPAGCQFGRRYRYDLRGGRRTGRDPLWYRRTKRDTGKMDCETGKN